VAVRGSAGKRILKEEDAFSLIPSSIGVVAVRDEVVLRYCFIIIKLSG